MLNDIVEFVLKFDKIDRILWFDDFVVFNFILIRCFILMFSWRLMERI